MNRKQWREIGYIIGFIVIVALILGIIAMFTVGRPKVVLDGETYTLLYGDTLWSIAREHCPEDMDLRDYIYRVENLNGIKSGKIYAGDTITILVEADR